MMYYSVNDTYAYSEILLWVFEPKTFRLLLFGYFTTELQETYGSKGHDRLRRFRGQTPCILLGFEYFKPGDRMRIIYSSVNDTKALSETGYPSPPITS